MNVQGLPFDLARRLVVALGLMIGMAVSGSTALASCGDYLLHGPLQTTGDRGGGYQFGFAGQSRQPIRPGDKSLLNPLDQVIPGSSSQPVDPPLPCAGGRCQSLPPVPPVHHPSRVTLWKPTAVIEQSDRQRRQVGRCDWSFPADGLCPPQPWLAVDVPPPKSALL